LKLRRIKVRRRLPRQLAGERSIVMAEARSDPRATPLTRGLAGAALVVAGLLGLVGLFYISNSRTEGAERAMIHLGLAGSVLLSAVAQGRVVIGVWLLWRAARRKPG
jgi:hypothetical protein